jgi:predicted HTH transcriptional regulator
VIIRKPNSIKVANPGGFRIDIKEAINGGTSDPRNATLMKMFNLVNVGERAGSGIPNIYAVWKIEGWDEPKLEERFSPDRTYLSLPIGNNAEEASDKMSDKSKASDKTSDNGDEQAIKRYSQAISEYLSEKDSCKASDVAALLELSPPRARYYLAQLVEQGVLVAEGSNKNRTYRLKKQGEI